MCTHQYIHSVIVIWQFCANFIPAWKCLVEDSVFVSVLCCVYLRKCLPICCVSLKSVASDRRGDSCATMFRFSALKPEIPSADKKPHLVRPEDRGTVALRLCSHPSLCSHFSTLLTALLHISKYFFFFFWTFPSKFGTEHRSPSDITFLLWPFHSVHKSILLLPHGILLSILLDKQPSSLLGLN